MSAEAPEDRGAESRGFGRGGEDQGHERFDRTPPQDIAAEQSVLGGMMLSKDAIADVIENLRDGDFYRPAHQLIFGAVLDLYSKGEPADAVTVAAELTRKGELARVGGGIYLHTLIAGVPTAANAGYYAQIVAERATLRRLVEAGTRIVQMGYGAAGNGNDQPGDVDAVVDRAQAEIYEVTERRTAEDYVPISELLQSTMDELDRISETGGIGTGIPTGFMDLDQITNGLHPGQMITVAGRPGSGKALALDTALATPTGTTTMGEVAVGDLLVGADGRPTRVLATTEVMTDRPCFTVTFSDGAQIVADAEHQWVVTAVTPALVGAGIGAGIAAGAGAGVGATAGTRADGTAPLAPQPVRLVVTTTAELALALLTGHELRLAHTHDVRVVDVRASASVPVRCVQVDNASRLYLAGPTRLPTHNSTLALDFARSAAIKHNKTTAIFSLEMGKTEMMMRLFSAEASVPLANMRSGRMSDQDWTRVARRSGQMAEAPLFIDDSPNLTMMEIRAKARRLSQRNDLAMVVIDYLQLMTSGKRVESRQQEVSEFSRAIKLLAKELEVPVVTLSQLNRGPEQRTDKKPMLADLRESGSIEQDSDLVILVHREDMYERESVRAGEADLIIAKHRNGPLATVPVAFQGHLSRFADMATG